MSDVVVDASVWVSRLVAGDVHHARCQAWFQTQSERGSLLIAPILVLAEIAGAIVRRTGQPDLADAAVKQVQRLPGLRLVPLDAALARLAAGLASQHSRRGVDAVYVATAHRLQVPLVTLDDEQLRRGQAVVAAKEPG
jgi:predicted nucleic acid-binding protein